MYDSVDLQTCGIPPVEFEIHRQALGYLGSIACKETSAEYSVAKRQLIVKTADSPSWFNYIRSICIKYDLPSPREILDHQPSKNKWKHQVKAAMSKYWEAKHLDIHLSNISLHNNSV